MFSITAVFDYTRLLEGFPTQRDREIDSLNRLQFDSLSKISFVELMHAVRSPLAVEVTNIL